MDPKSFDTDHLDWSAGMSLILPDWVEHHSDSDDKRKRQTIFSIHTHPDGTRLATGGIDQKIRIWATDPILYPDVEADKNVHKLLCTLSRHTGMFSGSVGRC